MCEFSIVKLNDSNIDSNLSFSCFLFSQFWSWVDQIIILKVEIHKFENH